MDQRIDQNLSNVLFIAWFYEVLTTFYPTMSQRVLSAQLQEHKDLVITEDILNELKKLRDLMGTPYIEYSYKVTQFQTFKKRL